MEKKKKPPTSAGKGKRTKQPDVGRTVQTRDEYFEGQSTYRKPGYEGKGNYRKAVVVAQYGKDLAVVKTTKGSPRGIPLQDEKVSKYRPYVHTRDNEKKPIRYNRKFIPNEQSKNFSMRDIIQISIDCFAGDEPRQRKNRNKVRKMKGRPPLK